MQPNSVTHIRRPRPIIGWALTKLVECDAVHPSTLRLALTASLLRRQAIFLTLSHLHFTSLESLAARLCPADLSSSSDPLNSIISALGTMRVRDLVQAHHPGVAGLMGALNRLGDEPLHPVQYRSLVNILSSPDQRRAKVLRQLQEITALRLTVVRMIKPELPPRSDLPLPLDWAGGRLQQHGQSYPPCCPERHG